MFFYFRWEQFTGQIEKMNLPDQNTDSNNNLTVLILSLSPPKIKKVLPLVLAKAGGPLT